MHTPWGTADHITKIGDKGILNATTPSHGGIFVPSDLLKQITADHDPSNLMPAKLPTDCIFARNTYSGFANDHNGRCPKAFTDPNPHLTTTTHHVRVGGSCLEVCSNCAVQYAKRKDAIVREL